MSFDFFDQERKIPMKGRLSPREANPVDPTLK
jgi:hypothetical protein